MFVEGILGLVSFPCGSVCDAYPQIFNLFLEDELREREEASLMTEPKPCPLGLTFEDFLKNYEETDVQKDKPRKLCWKYEEYKDPVTGKNKSVKIKHYSRFSDLCA
ncbi:hypothetical protein [Candidatus Mycoplasma haematohominis]|uniref:Uncharacterized protein n=1 Tax=Candidatus Mycoplasma haematohominis TaxID=1494318 RepID=A0A478FPI7_9MOLU|nr:hypothetical protein [Candidatus Mycoplasma haemohominis]GCE63152.1 hypothetical protein MHSWG343_01300 [Candidatus Mycoplasma haemohominis]